MKQENADVIVIGGGAIGLCCAYYLARAGLQVCLLEKGTIGAGCSDKNAGLIVPSHVVPLAAPGMISLGLKWMLKPDSPFYLRPRFNFEFANWLWHFSRACTKSRLEAAAPVLQQILLASSALFLELEKEQNTDLGLMHNGLLMLYKTPAAEKANRHEAELAHKLGQQVAILNKGQVEELQPGVQLDVHGGVHYLQDSHLNPAKLIASLREAATNLNVQLHQNVAVGGFRLNNGRITAIHTSAGTFAARDIVFAAGAWSSELAAQVGLRLPLQAGKGYSVTLPAENTKLQVPCLLSEARVAVTPLGKVVRFAGTMEMIGLDLSISKGRVQAIVNAASDYLPQFHAPENTHLNAWAGLRPCSPDGLPYIGRSSELRNLTIATGHAMLGISLAPITGKLISDIIRDKQTEISLAPFRPDRFR